jgi:CDP-glycerol glycerophosphotransferase (TagB/SpsB family)
VSVLAAADLLITDGLSVLVEYQLLERPIVFFEREGHRAFNEIGEARHVAEPLLEGGADPLAPIQRENAQRLFGNSHSADRILSTLREMIAAERGSLGARTGDPAGR